jgi:hypothetical protein
VVKVLYKINRPSHLRWAIWFDFLICLLARLRPTIRSIVIIIIVVIIGEANTGFHDGGIIAQSHFSRADSCLDSRGNILKEGTRY